MVRGIEVHNGQVIIPKETELDGDVLLHGKKVFWGKEAVTGSVDKDLTTEFSAIDVVVAQIGTDLADTAMWAEGKPGAVAGHIDLKVWKPTAVDGTSANVTALAATTEADVHYVVVGDPA